ncbi:MAG: hypothetical protein KIT69_11415 [Propionibacteriaceae bacterium]|nr:hypothetical protein [Propionibacteriaceae bacterium]
MRRLCVALLVAGCLMLGAARATADDFTVYLIENANLSISMPSEIAVVTRDGIQSHAEELEELGLDLPGLLQLLESNGGYLDAIATDVSHEYMVAVIEPPNEQRVWSFGKLSDDLLKDMSSPVAKEIEKTGYQAAFDEIHRVGEVAYMVMSGSGAGQDHYRQYYTIVNGRMTSITLHSYIGPISDEQAATHQRIVDSARFLEIIEDPHPELDPTRVLSAVESWVLPVRIAGGVILAGIVGLVIVLTRRNRKQKAAGSYPTVPSGPEALPLPAPPSNPTGPPR